MTRIKPVQRAARRRGEGHSDGGDPRNVTAALHRLNTSRLEPAWLQGLVHKPIRDGAAHALAIRRLDTAVDDHKRAHKKNDALRGTSDTHGAEVALVDPSVSFDR